MDQTKLITQVKIDINATEFPMEINSTVESPVEIHEYEVPIYFYATLT